MHINYLTILWFMCTMMDRWIIMQVSSVITLYGSLQFRFCCFIVIHELGYLSWSACSIWFKPLNLLTLPSFSGTMLMCGGWRGTFSSMLLIEIKFLAMISAHFSLSDLVIVFGIIVCGGGILCLGLLPNATIQIRISVFDAPSILLHTRKFHCRRCDTFLHESSLMRLIHLAQLFYDCLWRVFVPFVSFFTPHLW